MDLEVDAAVRRLMAARRDVRTPELGRLGVVRFLRRRVPVPDEVDPRRVVVRLDPLARPAELRAIRRAAFVQPPAVAIRAAVLRRSGAVPRQEEGLALAERQAPRVVDGPLL